jgi:hypothetical protein
VDNAVDDSPSGGLRVVVAVAAVGVLLALGHFYGYLRAGIAVGMFTAILVFGFRYIQQLGLAPPEPEISDVSEHGLKYVCTMCGLELRVEKAARDKAPTHCMEPMVLIREGGTPPLRPV